MRDLNIKREPNQNDTPALQWSGLPDDLPENARCFYVTSRRRYVRLWFGIREDEVQDWTAWTRPFTSSKADLKPDWKNTVQHVLRTSMVEFGPDQMRMIDNNIKRGVWHVSKLRSFDGLAILGTTCLAISSEDIPIGNIGFPPPSYKRLGLLGPVLSIVQQEFEEVLF